MMKYRYAFLLLGCLAVSVVSVSAWAQTDASPDVSVEEKAAAEGKDINVYSLSPLMFTADEYFLLQKAMQEFTTRPPTAAAVRSSQEFGEDTVLDPGIRELSLSGIVYRGKSDWTIWFNEQRVTPKAIPEEVLDLKVTKDYIDLKWYDGYTNRIFPVRLRPHQRFNLDTRIFLPG
jgi:hypothetical protein